MKFGALEFDASIVEALRNGTLVVFAGAGISMGEPANMPDFVQLALQIAGGKCRENNEPPERFLGRLYRSGMNVYKAAAEKLDIQGRKPNQLHFDLLQLFESSQNAKIVTTNFDLFFEAAARSVWKDDVEVYSTPALPRGSNFHGIVHLHGNTRKPQEMVLTDADYGRAYLTEGWARQFLVDLFYNHTVLFVGYSHDDRVMQYLSRGLPTERIGKRFALCEESRKQHWENLDIQPLPFPQPKGVTDYSLLMDGMHGLAEFCSSGISQWHSEIEQIMDADPNTSPNIGEQALAMLSDLRRACLLMRRINSPKWLIWMDKQNILKELFGPQPLSDMSEVYSQWISSKYVIQHPSYVIYLLTKFRGKINPSFWGSICRKLTHSNRLLDTVCFRRYAAILLDSVPDESTFHLFGLAEEARNRNDTDTLLQIFIAMCKGRVSYRQYSTLEIADDYDKCLPETEISHKEGAYEAEKTWDFLKPYIPIFADRLISHLFGQFLDYHQKLGIWNRDDSRFDSVSFRRNAIDPRIHKVIRPSTMDVMIDAVLDVFDWYCNNAPRSADYWIGCFMESKVPILKRIAIFAMGVRTNIPADERLKWFLTNVDIFERLYGPEVYSFLKITYMSTSVGVRDKLLNQIMLHLEPGCLECTAEENTERVQFEKLSWLYEMDTAYNPVSKRLNEIKAKHPSWEPYPYPSEFRHMTSGIYHPISPYTSDNLLQMNPQYELENWLSYKGNSMHGPNQDGLFREINNACKEDFAWGISLFQALTDKMYTKNRLTAEVLYAWHDRGLTNDEWLQIIPLLSSSDLYANQTYALARLLSRSINDGELSNKIIEMISILVSAIWPYAVSAPTTNYKNDLSMLILNHPAGMLAEFWFMRLNRKLRLDEVNGEVLLKEELKWLKGVLEGDSEATVCIEYLCGRFLSTLFMADRPWTERCVLHCFTSSMNNQFQAVWSGMLTNQQLMPSMIEALIPAITYAAENPGRLRTDDIQDFASLLVFLASVYTEKDCIECVITYFLRTDSAGKAAFFSALKDRLSISNVDEKENQWEKWLSSFIHGYTNGFYGEACGKSLSALLSCLQHLDKFYPLSIKEILTINNHDEIGGYSLGSLDESDLIERYPQESALLLIFIIPKLPLYDYYSVEGVIQHLPELDPDTQERLNRELLARDWPLMGSDRSPQ